ncbi:MAG TPA: hypothetical protein VIF82_07435 [Burkholderiaceae bacterium]|jgi:hypothetical protein
MKTIFTLLVSVTISGFCHADCIRGAEIANRFMNEYKKYSDEVLNRKSHETVEQWIQRNKLITVNFKNTYKKLIEIAHKQDPELGLGSDPIFDAQDYPDQGFVILDCDEKSNLVTLKGKDWEAFKVVVKVNKFDEDWLVDGAGIINIPKNKRAKRD